MSSMTSGQSPMALFLAAFTVVMVTVSGCDSASTPDRQAVATSAENQSPLDRLELLGAADHTGRSFSYESIGACTLRVTTSLYGSPAGRFDVDLANAKLDAFSFADSLGYAVRLLSDPKTPTLFSTTNKENAIQALSLVESLGQHCRKSTPGAGTASPEK